MSILILSIVLGGFLLYNTLIYYRHSLARDAVKIRVHVNGTRGKSSVTRLIAAGLREGGIRTLAKVTGTAPAIIYPDGSEKIIIRLQEKGNIIEQILAFKEAAKASAQVVIAECQALRPNLQRISEDKLLKSTLGVITNIRADHLDIMGPTIKDVAEAIFNAIPKDATLITAEKEFIEAIRKKAGRLNTKVIEVKGGIDISNEMMSGFSYLEHRENVALALAACENLGVRRDVALRGMHKANPDPGVLRTFKIYKDDKYIEFINALATNDPISLIAIWQRMLKKITENQLKIVLINSRRDRYSRSQQLIELVVQDLPTGYCILIGEATNHLAGSLVRNGLNQDKIINMHAAKPSLIFDKVLSLTQKSSVVFAIGNIADKFNLGMRLVDYFKERSQTK